MSFGYFLHGFFLLSLPGYSTGVMGLHPGMWAQPQQYPMVAMPLPPRRAATPPHLQAEDDTPEPPAKRQRVGASFDWAPDFDTSLFEQEKHETKARVVAPPLLTPAPTPSPEQEQPEDLSGAQENDPLAASPPPASYSEAPPEPEVAQSTPYLPKLEPISPPEPSEHRPDSPEGGGEPPTPVLQYTVSPLTPDSGAPPHALQTLHPPHLQQPQHQPDAQLHLQAHPHAEALQQPQQLQNPLAQRHQQQHESHPPSRLMPESVHLEQLGTVTISSAYPVMSHHPASHAEALQVISNESQHPSHHHAALHHSTHHHHESSFSGDHQRLQTIQEQQVIPITYMAAPQDGGQGSAIGEGGHPSFRPSYAGEGLPAPPRRRVVRTMSNYKYTREKNAECYICHKKYESKYKLKLHMYSHTGERPFVCEVCGIGFTRGPNLNAHRRVHSGAKPFPCTRCGRGFRHPSDRIVHMVTEVCTRVSRHVQATASGGWMCGACGEENFESEEQAERHARQHETGRAMACPVCLQNFKGCKAHRLVRHVREHHPEYITSLGL